MADRLEGDVELDIAAALRAVEELRSEIESQLSAAVDSFSDAFASAVGGVPPIEVEANTDAVAPDIESAVGAADATVPVDAETDEITPAIDDAVGAAEGIVPVDADASSIPGEIEDAVGSVTAEPIEIPVDADTSAAQASIDDLGGSLDAATGSAEGFSGGLGALQQGAGLMSGETAGLTAGLETLGDSLQGKVSPALGAVVAGTGLVVGAVGAFVNEAIDAKGATQLFEGALGNMADRVDNLRDIDGLNTNLSDLALTLGSDDDKIRAVAARLFTLASSSGVAKDQAAVFVQQMIALGANAVSLNPLLGDVGDVTNSLVAAFVRGGQRAANLGISLSTAEIQSRALADTGKTTSSELSVVDKAMAGAALAAEKYGDNIAEHVAKGSENAVIIQRRFTQALRETVEELGAPLIAPMFELMEALHPLLESVGVVLASLGRVAIPLVTAAVRALVPLLEATAGAVEILVPPLELAADALNAIPAPVLSAVLAFALLPRILSGVSAAITGIGGILPTLSGPMLAAGDATAAASTKMSALVPAIAGIALPALAIVGVMYGLAKGMEAVFGGSNDIIISVDKFSSQSLPRLRTALSGVNDGITRYNSALRSLGLDAIDPARLKQFSFNAILEKSPESARGFIEAMRQAGHNTDSYEAALDRTIRKQAEHNIASQEFQGAVTAETAALGGATAETDKATQALDSFVDAATSGLPTAADALEGTRSAAEHFGTAFDPKILIEQLQRQIDAVANFTSNLKVLLFLGFNEVARLAIEQGPVAGGQLIQGLADGIRSGDPSVAAALDNTLGTVRSGTAAYEDFIRGTAGPLIDDAWLEFHAKFPQITRDTVNAADAAMAANGLSLAGTAGSVARSAADQYHTGVNDVEPHTASAMNLAANVLNNSYSIVGSPARIAGLAVGGAFGEGIRDGINQWVRAISDAAANAVDEAEAAAKRAQDSRSPSRVMMEVGADWSEGYALGIRSGAGAVENAAKELVHAAASMESPYPATSLSARNTQPVNVNVDVPPGGGSGNTYQISTAPMSPEAVAREIAWRERFGGR